MSIIDRCENCTRETREQCNIVFSTRAEVVTLLSERILYHAIRAQDTQADIISAILDDGYETFTDRLYELGCGLSIVEAAGRVVAETVFRTWETPLPPETL